MRPILALTAVALALSAAPALAHTEVKSTTPGKGTSASRSLKTVAVTFTQPVRSGTLRVTRAGRLVSKGSGARDPRNVARVRVRLASRLKAGRYKARWSIRAADGHSQSGSFSFRLR